ncbi:hypothetical protein PLICRDRAFT_53956 [Plicaturopsis crispa FD-325 SS-3]|nr:hypothetical protein PLICRDRAFT_53956 [Plicaturopsis crispa FD-325 SS-3]
MSLEASFCPQSHKGRYPLWQLEWRGHSGPPIVPFTGPPVIPFSALITGFIRTLARCLQPSSPHPLYPLHTPNPPPAMSCSPAYNPFTRFAHAVARACRSLGRTFSRRGRSTKAPRQFSPKKPRRFVRRIFSRRATRASETKSQHGEEKNGASPDVAHSHSSGGTCTIDTVSEDWKTAAMSRSDESAGESSDVETSSDSEEPVSDSTAESGSDRASPIVFARIMSHMAEFEARDLLSPRSYVAESRRSSVAGMRPLTVPVKTQTLYRTRSPVIGPYDVPQDHLCSVHQCLEPCQACAIDPTEPMRFPF